MLQLESLCSDLTDAGLQSWITPLRDLLAKKVAPGVHGDLPRWLETIEKLPVAEGQCMQPHPFAVMFTGPHLARMAEDELRDLLLTLSPWRKGPFLIGDINLDAEWRCDLKWNRISGNIAPLENKSVLDVGCGNGYYACRMRAAGAKRVIGIDPTLLFVCQFAALQKMSGVTGVHVLPLRLHELPAGPAGFDATFSMGVLYHQRQPVEHLRQLHSTLLPGGELILETLVLPGSGHDVLAPSDRYARMRNVWHLPTVASLTQWLETAGFLEIRVADVSVTTVTEQRSTSWMPFESLREALHPDDDTLTIEGLPRPTRAVLVGKVAE